MTPNRLCHNPLDMINVIFLSRRAFELCGCKQIEQQIQPYEKNASLYFHLPAFYKYGTE